MVTEWSGMYDHVRWFFLAVNTHPLWSLQLEVLLVSDRREGVTRVLMSLLVQISGRSWVEHMVGWGSGGMILDLACKLSASTWLDLISLSVSTNNSESKLIPSDILMSRLMNLNILNKIKEIANLTLFNFEFLEACKWQRHYLQTHVTGFVILCYKYKIFVPVVQYFYLS